MAKTARSAKTKTPGAGEPGYQIDEAAEAVRRAEYWLPCNEREYANTRNPLHVWAAINDCLVAGLSFPPWVQDYLFSASRELLRLSTEPSEAPTRGRIVKAVAKAMGFKPGRLNPFRDNYTKAHEIYIAMTVYQCYTRNWSDQKKGLGATHSWRTIYEESAASHNREDCDCGRTIGWKTAERIFSKHALSIIPPHLIERAQSKKVADILR